MSCGLSRVYTSHERDLRSRRAGDHHRIEDKMQLNLHAIIYMRDARCVRFSSHISTFVHTPHSSSTSPAQLQVPAAIPAPSHTPQRSTALPLFATPSHPAQLEPSPPHVPHASVTSPAQLHLPAGMPEPPQTCLQRFKAHAQRFKSLRAASSALSSAPLAFQTS